MTITADKKYRWGIFLLLFPLYMLFTFDHSLWNPDETRDAGIARSMYADKDFVVPRLNGEAFLEKPPLYYWTCSAIYVLTGKITAGTTRLPAALYGFLGLLFTFLIGQHLRNPRTGFIAASILGTSFQYFRMSHMVLMDSALAALIAGAFYFYVIEKNLLFVIFAVLAFYTKGFVALALMGLVITWDLFAQKNMKRWLKIIALGIPVFIVMVSPWVYGLWKSGGRPYLETFFIHNNFHRFTSAKADHTENPFYLYFLSFPGDFLPWTLLLIPAIFSLFKKQESKGIPSATKFPFRWFLGIFIFLTISSSKRSMYLLPAMPAAALILALLLDQHLQRAAQSWWSKPKTFWSVFIFMVGAVALLDIFAITKLDREKTFVPFVDGVKSKMAENKISPDHLIGFDLNEMERGVFTFYLEHNFMPILTREDFAAQMNQLAVTPHLLMINKNARERIGDIIDAHFKPVLDYRPDKKTRSYILYETKNKDGLKS